MPATAIPLPFDALRARTRSVIPDLEWEVDRPLIEAIRHLKVERHALILAHNYMSPAIFHGVADITGDSLALAREAARAEAEVLVVCGVHFMAETAKVLNPSRTVLIPDPRAGCSLAESITADDVRALRLQHPGVPVVAYVNTSAAVKAESDICCTSGNAVQVVESLGVPKVIFLPDRYLGRYVASRTAVEIVSWQGACEVHERFSGAQLRGLRAEQPGLHVIAHPECPPDVLAEADFVGSTHGMVQHLERVRPGRVALITECSMSANVTVQFPEIEFVQPCNLCPHMRRITLGKIRDALQSLQHPVEVDEAVAGGARRAVERMLAVH
jgi:quinolinate synthase